MSCSLCFHHYTNFVHYCVILAFSLCLFERINSLYRMEGFIYWGFTSAETFSVKCPETFRTTHFFSFRKHCSYLSLFALFVRAVDNYASPLNSWAAHSSKMRFSFSPFCFLPLFEKGNQRQGPLSKGSPRTLLRSSIAFVRTLTRISEWSGGGEIVLLGTLPFIALSRRSDRAREYVEWRDHC